MSQGNFKPSSSTGLAGGLPRLEPMQYFRRAEPREANRLRLNILRAADEVSSAAPAIGVPGERGTRPPADKAAAEAADRKVQKKLYFLHGGFPAGSRGALPALQALLPS